MTILNSWMPLLYKFGSYRKYYKTSYVMRKSRNVLVFRLPNSLTALMMGFLLSISGQIFAQDGAALFKGNCASCHRPTEEPLTGPGLKGVRERWEGREDLLYQWVKNPQKVIDAGDPYVKSLVAEYASAGVMTAQAVTNEQIDAILDYVDAYVPPVKEVPVAATGAAEGAESGNATAWILILIAVLLVVTFSAASTRKSLQEAINARDGVESDPNVTYFDGFKVWVGNNKVLTSIIVVFLLVGGTLDTWYSLKDVGVFQGYKPEQPIKFSHKIHAGQNEINCVYCHSGAEKSKHAGIPSPNVCMNCHSAISEGSITGKTEIAKIYEAVGWDAETRSYTGETAPIKWVKVHNLPDHVYFNHSQHVKVGEIECQTCHGPIDEEMDVAEQFAPLTMGWCIDCHNKTEVQMAGNGYYDDIHTRLRVEDLKSFMEDDKISVKELGGWECSKCHY